MSDKDFLRVVNVFCALMVAGAVALFIINATGCLPAEQPDEVVSGKTTADGLRATATAGLKALAAMTPLEAAGVLQAAMPDQAVTWHWAPPDSGAPVVEYQVAMAFTVRDTAFTFWFPSWAQCSGEVVVVRGVDALGRVGPESLPGVCE